MKGVSKVVHVLPAGERPFNPGFLDALRDLLRAQNVAWENAELLPREPEDGAVYLLHGGRDATLDVASFEHARGDVPPAVAARTILDLARRDGCLDILLRWRFPLALEDERRELIGRCEVFRAVYPGDEPGGIEVLEGDQVTTDYTYFSYYGEPEGRGNKSERVLKVIEAIGGSRTG